MADKHRSLAILCAMMVVLIMIPVLLLRFAVNLNSGSSSQAQSSIKPWTPCYGAPYGVDEDSQFYIPDLLNRSFAYVGYSDVSGFIVNSTELFFNASGAYSLVWIKEPDPSEPVNVDVLFIDGFWLMGHPDLAVQYIVSFLSIEEPTLWYQGLSEDWKQLVDNNMTWLKARIVIILPGAAPRAVLKMINQSSLVPNLIRPLSQDDIRNVSNKPGWDIIKIVKPTPKWPIPELRDETRYIVEVAHIQLYVENAEATYDNPLAWRTLIRLELTKIVLYWRRGY